MVKLGTGPEYFPPLPEEFPASVVSDLKHCGKPFTHEQWQRISQAAYLLVDSIYRHACRPNAGKVRKRLSRVIKLLVSARDAKKLREGMHKLLQTDEVGEVLGSLLMSSVTSQRPIATLSPDALESRRADLLAAAAVLPSRLESDYRKRGREPTDYRDVYILRLAEIYASAGGRPSAAYSADREGRDTPFVRLVTAVAGAALACFAPDILAGRCAASGRIRDSLKLGAFEERVRLVREHFSVSRNRGIPKSGRS
jgi:hypothetical protein